MTTANGQLDEAGLDAAIERVRELLAPITGRLALRHAGDRSFSAPQLDAMPDAGLAGYIDSTLLMPRTTPDMVERLCEEAIEHRFAAVCVNPVHVPRCAQLLDSSPVRLVSVVSFPLGAHPAEFKAREAMRLVEMGATELDMVINLGYLRAGMYGEVREEIEAVVQSATAPVKVIIEAGALCRDEKIAACLLAQAAGAAQVKTSTGMIHGGASPEDVALMRRVVGGALGVKAAGGIRTAACARAMLAAGASRIGTSAALEIIGKA